MKEVHETYLFNFDLVDKDDLRIEVVGNIDEANAFIGLAKVKVEDENLRKILEDVQKMMFKAGSQSVDGPVKISQKDVEHLTNAIDNLQKTVRMPNSFILLEKDEVSALLSIARSVVRRAERRAVTLYKNGLVERSLVEWLNKLSYLLYLIILAVQGGEYEPIRL